MKTVKICHRTNRLLNTTVFFFVILTLNLAIFPVLAGGQTASFKGRVIDEDGQGLGGVKIEAYSSPGNFLYGIAYTDPDGYFSIDSLPIDKYSLHFSKTGYATNIISVDASVQWPDLGDIILRKALRLSSTTLSMVANPGEKIILPFTVSNIGEESEVVEFYMSKPNGWTTRILHQAHEVTKLNLLTGTSLDLQLEVTIPLTSSGENNLTLVAIGKTNSTINFMIQVEPSNNPIMSCQFPGKSVVPSETAKFQVSLKNPFDNVEMLFKVCVDSIPSDWETLIKSVGGEAITEITLKGGESADLIVEVTPPSTASPGKYGIVVKVESSDGRVTSLLPLSITVREPEEEEEVEVAATFREVTVEAGKVVKFPLTIINSGETDKALLLSVEEYPTNWKVTFKSEDIEVSGIYLPAGESANLVVEVTPPSTVSLGSYTIPVNVKSGDGAINIQLELKANIIGSYEVSLEASTLLTSVTVGGQTTFTAKIKNVGQTPVTGVKINVDAPEEWEASVTPVQVESLKPLESYTFTITVETPEDTVAGDYLLTLKGLSDQVESGSVSVRITVTTPTSWGMIGIGIAIVAIVALILAFVKFKRR
jgi:uncharacterized membrane protein